MGKRRKNLRRQQLRASTLNALVPAPVKEVKKTPEPAIVAPAKEVEKTPEPKVKKPTTKKSTDKKTTGAPRVRKKGIPKKKEERQNEL